MKRKIVATLLTAMTIGAAAAADLPVPPPGPVAYAPAVIPTYNWGGVYAGINGGWAFGSAQWTAPSTSSDSISASGGIAGGTLGANWQTGAFVFGLEGDIDYSGVGTGVAASNVCAASANCQVGTTWLSTVRTRLGYADDRLLFYGTVGGGFGNVRISANGVSNDTTRSGWTAGGGVELAFAGNWTGRLEYLYTELQNASCSAACGGSPIGVRLSENLIRAGVDFKFWP